jgi:hypothetical protein
MPTRSEGSRKWRKGKAEKGGGPSGAERKEGMATALRIGWMQRRAALDSDSYYSQTGFCSDKSGKQIWTQRLSRRWQKKR